MPTPPDWNTIEKHPMLPEATHDEVARFNFLANMNRHLAAYVSPGNRKAYDERVRPRAEVGVEPRQAHAHAVGQAQSVVGRKGDDARSSLSYRQPPPREGRLHK